MSNPVKKLLQSVFWAQGSLQRQPDEQAKRLAARLKELDTYYASETLRMQTITNVLRKKQKKGKGSKLV